MSGTPPGRAARDPRAIAPPRVCVLLLAFFVATAAATSDRVASAHVGHVILRAERYLKLDATDADTRLVVSLTLGPEEGRRVLASADADSDGEVSAAESERYLGEWAAGLRTEIPVDIDGAHAELAWTDGWLEPIGPVVRTPLTLELVAHLPTTGMEHVVTFRDEMVRREVYDRTDIAFRGHQGAELVRSGIGESPEGIDEDLGLSGLERAEVFTARIRYPRRTWLSTLPRTWLAAAGASLAVVVVAIAAVSRRWRRASRARP